MLTTTPAVGDVATGRCQCHHHATVTGVVLYVNIVRMQGRPVRLLTVEGPNGSAHNVAAGNLITAKG